MRNLLRRHIPSMFHRRLLLLAAAGVVVALLLGARTATLTLGKSGLERKHAAENRLLMAEWVPTVRGRILDRQGRVLAADEPGFDVSVHYDVISGKWVDDQARRRLRDVQGARLNEMEPADYEALLAEYRQQFEAEAESLWQILAEAGGVDRAEIERRRDRIISRVQRIHSEHVSHRQQILSEQTGEPVAWEDAEQSVQEQTWHHPILRDINDQTRLVLEGLIAEAMQEKQDRDPKFREMSVWRELRVERPQRRRYPLETQTILLDTDSLPSPLRDQHGAQPLEITVEGVGMHLIGQMRPVWEQDMTGPEARPFSTDDRGGYQPGDWIGKTGVEQSAESRLRGMRGRVVTRLDTLEKDAEPPTPGRDVQLSIDIHLQAVIQAILSPQIGLTQTQPWHHAGALESGRVGTPLNGAAVVMDVKSGELLAAVSVPSMPLRLLDEQPEVIYLDQANMPYLNRCVARPYEPGSTVKPMLLAAVYTDGLLGLDERVYCGPSLWEQRPDVFREWSVKLGYDPFGEIDGVFAIARSSNVFFGLMAQRLGPRRISWWFEQFGLGRRTGVGLEEEVAGSLPASDRPTIDAGWEYMGIGQNQTWTPVHAVTAYSALARGGVYIRPTLVRGDTPPAQRDLQLNTDGLARVLEGMRLSANDPMGTTHHIVQLNREQVFNVAGVTVMAKSGTAKAPPIREAIDDDGDGVRDRWGDILQGTRGDDFYGDHAWCVALVKPADADQPTHAIAVVVEYAGSGGAVSAPIINQIIHALLREGYLE